MSATQILPNSSRLEKLNIAASLYSFDQALNRSAKGSIGWGIFSLCIGMLVTLRGAFGWVNIMIGALLVLEGIYQMRVRDPKVIKVAAASLGFLALWNLVVLFSAAYLHRRAVVLFPFATLLQGIGAWATYKSYSVYVTLKQASDPQVDGEFRSLIEELKSADPRVAPDVVQFTTGSFGKETFHWKVRKLGDLLLFVQSSEVLGKKSFGKTSFVVEKHNVSLDITGEKLFGRDVKAIIRIGINNIENANLSPEMAQKLQALIS